MVQDISVEDEITLGQFLKMKASLERVVKLNGSSKMKSTD